MPGADKPLAEAAAWLRRLGVEPASREAGSTTRGTSPGDADGAAFNASERPHSPVEPMSDPEGIPPERLEGVEDAEADPELIARTIALRKLTAQARTRHELAVALRSRNVPEDTAGEVLDRLGEVGLIDDGVFAEDWVASRQQRRHLSRSALRQELQRKGVARDQIDQALEQVTSDAEYRAALDLARRKHAGMSGLEPEVRYRRLAGALARRGFAPAVTSRVLRDLLGGFLGDD